MATVDRIKSYILAHLNLKQETTLLETLWFEIAHKELQRRHNFGCMQTYAGVTIVPGQGYYGLTSVWDGDIPSANLIEVKEWGWYGYAYNQSTGETRGAYQQKGIKDIESVSVDTTADIHATVANLTTDGFFTTDANSLIIYPEPPASLNGFIWFSTSWKWLPAPTGTEEDWFCRHATDYLIYRSLLESATFMDHPIFRIEGWQRASENAFQQLLALDALAKHAGPLRARG